MKSLKYLNLLADFLCSQISDYMPNGIEIQGTNCLVMHCRPNFYFYDLPIFIKFRNNLMAPLLPAGNCLKNTREV